MAAPRAATRPAAGNHRLITMTRHIISIGLALAIAACSSPTEPTIPIAPAPVINVFSGTLPVQGSSIFSMTVTQASTATIMLASLTSGGLPVSRTVGLALGTPAEGETTCPHTIDRRLTPALTPQIRTDRTTGTHCVEIYDAGGLGSDVDFAIRTVVTPVTNTSTPRVAPGVDSFSSILMVQGSASRTVVATESGSLSTTLTSATPPNLLVGLGLGIPRSDGSGCHLSIAVNTSTSASAVISSAVDVGSYCVKLYDPGTLPSNVNFTISTTHP
jgi:hypothetical protein